MRCLCIFGLYHTCKTHIHNMYICVGDRNYVRRPYNIHNTHTHRQLIESHTHRVYTPSWIIADISKIRRFFAYAWPIGVPQPQPQMNNWLDKECYGSLLYASIGPERFVCVCVCVVYTGRKINTLLSLLALNIVNRSQRKPTPGKWHFKRNETIHFGSYTRCCMHIRSETKCIAYTR